MIRLPKTTIHCIVLTLLTCVMSDKTFAQTQEILNPPLNMAVLDEVKVNTAIANLDEFLNSIYRSKKLASVAATAPPNYSEERWPEGSWSNGRLTDFYEVSKFMNVADDYTSWYEGIEENGNMDYPGNRPMIRDVGRILTGYINLFEAGYFTSETVKERIAHGVQFLLNEQLTYDFVPTTNEDDRGSFMRWYSRPLQGTANSGGNPENGFNNRPEQFDSGFGIEALTAAYFFFEKHGIPTGQSFTLNNIATAIDKTATWNVIHMDNHPRYNKDDCPEGGWTRNTNQLTCSIWSLINAYKITKKPQYLNKAIDGFERSVYFHQRPDGAWSYYQCGKCGGDLDYHDSQAHYAGIILRNLVELYDQTYCEYQSNFLGTTQVPIVYSKNKLREKIILTINHFLKEGMSIYEPSVRLQSDGQLADYYKLNDRTKHDIDVSYEFFDALLYFKRSDLYKELIPADQEKIDVIMPAVLAAGVERLAAGNIGSYSAAFRSLSYYKRWKNPSNEVRAKLVLYSPNGDAVDDNRIGIFNINAEKHIGYSNVGGYYHAITTADFDHDGEDEIVMYTKNDGRVAIYKPGYNAYTGCTPVYAGSIYTNFQHYDLMEAIDYTGSGYRDHIVLFNKTHSGQSNRIDIYNKSGKQSGGYSNASHIFKLMTTGDFDHDGKDEIALYNDGNGQITIYNPDVATTNGIAVYTQNAPVFSSSIATQFTLHDMMQSFNIPGDNDEYRDEIVMCNQFYAGSYNRIDILNTSGYVSSRYSNASGLFQTVATGDFDNDGDDEVAFLSSTGQISYYHPELTINSQHYNEGTDVFEARINTGATNYTMMAALSKKRETSLQASARLREPSTNNDKASADKDEISIYPNPAANKIAIRYSLSQPASVNITLTNVLGEVISVIEDSDKNKGPHSIEYEKEPTASGIYFINFLIGKKKIATRKVFFEK